jgi:hypothetical protein
MTEAEERPARFCGQCGRSLVPLDVPHVERPCGECGRSVYLVERSEEGGIQVRERDKFTIPGDWLTMSLDPAKQGASSSGPASRGTCPGC